MPTRDKTHQGTASAMVQSVIPLVQKKVDKVLCPTSPPSPEDIDISTYCMSSQHSVAYQISYSEELAILA